MRASQAATPRMGHLLAFVQSVCNCRKRQTTVGELNKFKKIRQRQTRIIDFIEDLLDEIIYMQFPTEKRSDLDAHVDLLKIYGS
jgi:hypothetical protein